MSFVNLHLDFNKVVSRTGYYVCFCRNELYNLEMPPTKIYKLPYLTESG